MSKPRNIAFYLPQFYPTPENDRWWYKGFTEWQNVALAKPLFKGHYQPRIPADLGFYDLRLPEVREQQTILAKEAGIEGFCYWHYWLGKGKRLLDRVFNEIVESGKPDFPFCLCWANHSWYAKNWNPNVPDRLLAEQTYPGTQDYTDHFYAMLPAFKDHRYITVNGKLLFGIFIPSAPFDFAEFANVWNSLAEDNNLSGFHFFGFCHGTTEYRNAYQPLFNSMVLDPIFGCFNDQYNSFWEVKINRWKFLHNMVHYMDYNTYKNRCVEIFKRFPFVFPCINPNYDHSPRSKKRANILHNSTPERWAELYKTTAEMFSYRPHEENLIFIKSWNEWGEGNYLEPDIRYGKQYIQLMAEVYKNLK